MPRYLLEGVATPEVFASMLKSPQDRGPNAMGLVEKAGGTLVDYYFGVHNCKNYVIVDLPGEKSLAELQMVLYGSGGINAAAATEIKTSSELMRVAEDAGKLTSVYGIPE